MRTPPLPLPLLSSSSIRFLTFGLFCSFLYFCVISQQDPLVAPCDCKGDTRYLHVQCLQKWFVYLLFAPYFRIMMTNVCVVHCVPIRLEHRSTSYLFYSMFSFTLYLLPHPFHFTAPLLLIHFLLFTSSSSFSSSSTSSSSFSSSSSISPSLLQSHPNQSHPYLHHRLCQYIFQVSFLCLRTYS